MQRSIALVAESAFSLTTTVTVLRDPGADEPVEVTDLDGNYEFTGLGARIVSVTTELDSVLTQLSPIGNRFSESRFELFAGNDLLGFKHPETVAESDFDFDGDSDLAVLISDRNAIAIRFGDGEGRFSSRCTRGLSCRQTVTLPVLLKRKTW